jgi:hypothetical protein
MTRPNHKQNNMESYSAHLYDIGPVKVYGNGFWHHPWFARNVLCGDQHRRTAYYNTDATSVRVRINQHWQKGFLTTVTLPEDCMFVPYLNQGKQ